MKTLKDLFEHQIQDLYSAETQLTIAIPKMIDKAKDQKLKQAFKDHLNESNLHVSRLEEICDDLLIDARGEACKAMKGLIAEAEDFMKEDLTDDVLNAGIIAAAQRIEHYEISGYGTVITYAKDLGYQDIANKLKETLEEEKGADHKLQKLAENKINEKAI